jgi:hypothetical protein
MTVGGLAAAGNNAATQAFATHSVNPQNLAIEGLIGTGLGAFDQLAESAGVNVELQRALITGGSTVLGAICDPGGIPVGVPVCGNGKAGP